MKLLEIQADCVQKNKDYTIKEIATQMKDDEEILIEKYYNGETAKVKDGIEENLVNLKGIVVSVDSYESYRKYKFLIGESGEIKGVIEGEISNTTKEEEFKSLEQFEKEGFGEVVEENNEKEEKILYPNSAGTNDSTTPSEIGLNQLWKIDNPYPGEEIYCTAELEFDTDGDGAPDTWNGINGFVFNSRGYGVTASHVKSETEDYIAITSGNGGLNSYNYDTGLGLNNIVAQTSLPVRVKVYKIKKENVKTLYPNEEGTNSSVSPNEIGLSKLWKINNPYPGEDIYCRAELEFDTDGDGTPDTWNGINGFVFNKNGYGVEASHVKSDTEDYIAIASGSGALDSGYPHTGLGLNLPNERTLLPVRVKVFKMEKENSKVLYPNEEGTSSSIAPNEIGLNKLWKIDNPFPGKEIYCRAELEFDTDGDGAPDTWNGINDFIYTGTSPYGGIGTLASHIKSDTKDYIAVSSGLVGLNSYYYHTGLGIENTAPMQTSLPVRIKVFKMQ